MSYSKYHKDFDNGEKLYELAQTERILELVSWDGELEVDFKYLSDEKYHTRGMAVKYPKDKSFGKSRLASQMDVINYLSQFRLRED